MANLTAVFELVDNMSDKLNNIATAGETMLDNFERMSEGADQAFGIASSTADGVATSIENYSQATEQAASQTDYWTEAVGNYDKSLLEATRTTEELVAEGYKSAEAINVLDEMLALCEKSANSLNMSMEATTDIEKELSAAMGEAASLSEQFAESEGVSVETMTAFTTASEAAAEAMRQLEAAQQEAENAMAAYDEVMASGTEDLNELESAAERAGHAAEDLAEANGRASEASEDLAKATSQASEEMENAANAEKDAGENGISAIEGIASALAAAGITATVKEIAEGVYELAEASSEAESIVVQATGATGAALDGLNDSMMNVYAASKTGSLDETAAAVGEINTRLGYTGDILEDTTELFLDFAAVTGGNAANSVRSVTQLMYQWNIEASDMENVMDKLTYAGQASGISVDTLSGYLVNNKAILDQLGFSLDEAIAMFMNFELVGTDTTAVMTGFRTALSSGAISSLDELYNVLDRAAAGEIEAAEAGDIFGKKAGPAIVNAAKNGVFALDELVKALDNSSGTLATTAETAQTLSQKWEQAMNNISSAFTKALSPTIDSISSDFADLANKVGDFLNEHQNVTKIISAVGVGLGTVALGIAGVAASSLTAIPAVTAFGAALSTALGPIGWVAAGVAAVTGIVLVCGEKLLDTMDITTELTQSSQDQYNELQSLEKEYENVCEEYGSTSREAAKLKVQIDDLSASFEANKRTIGDMVSDTEELENAINEINDTYENTVKGNMELEARSNNLIGQLAALSSQANLTSGDLSFMSGVVDTLNDSYEGLNLTLDGAGKLNLNPTELYAYTEQQTDEANRKATETAFNKAIGNYTKAKQDAEEAAAEANAAWNTYKEMEKQWQQEHPIKAAVGKGAEMNWDEGLDEQFDKYIALKDAAGEQNSEFDELADSIEKYGKALGYSDEEMQQYIESLADTYDYTQDLTDAEKEAAAEAAQLKIAYNEAYEAALASFEGQFGLFDKAEVDSEKTVAAFQAAMDSQIAYWQNYSANVDTLKTKTYESLGVAEEDFNNFMAYLQSGSAEAVSLADSVAEAVESGNTQAVANAITAYGEMQAAQQQAAAANAEWVTGFQQDTQTAVDTVTEAVQEMDLSAEASMAATSTMTSYASGITTGTSAAVSAAEAVVAAVTAVFASANPTINIGVTTSGSIPGHATGTTDAEDVFIAGEDGPELITGHQGSTVFPATETAKIISAVVSNDNSIHYLPPTEREGSGSNEESRVTTRSEVDKKISLELVGSGKINVNGGNKDEVLELLYENLKPVLAKILVEEVFEEGVNSYDY